ncbi:MAG: hotdog domain-containing protein [Acidimicrobiales bacterium]
MENHVLGPMLVGKAVKLSPPATMTAALVGVPARRGWGALLAVPVVGAAKALYLEARPQPPVDTGEGSACWLPARRHYRAEVTLHRLDNQAWGFRSNCFVCEPANPGGLRLALFHDDEAGTVVADLRLDDTFSGPPNYVHGGVTLAVLDEAMAWAAIALAGSFALTRTTSATFVRPVRVGEPYRVEARVDGADADGTLRTTGVVRDAAGRPCVEAEARFVPMDTAAAAAAIGEVAGDDTEFVRG